MKPLPTSRVLRISDHNTVMGDADNRDGDDG